jgi:imidazolonepropionase-like amidohydrolase
VNEYWITGATVVEVSGAEPRAISIGIRDDRIIGLGKPPAGVSSLDATGLTMTPGLIDAHVHLGLSSEIDPSFRRELSIAELAADIFRNCAQTLEGGFTTVRDTGGIDGGVAAVVASGKIAGPRILQCGPVQCQTGGHGHFTAEWEPTADWDDHALPGLRHHAMLSDSPGEMRKNVRESFRRGADFLKLCVTGGVVSRGDRLSDTQLTAEEIAVAVHEAQARGTYVTVHAHNNAGIRNAIAAGVRCVEHGTSIDEATAALMAERGVALVPTLAVVEALTLDQSVTGIGTDLSSRLGDVKQRMTDALLAARAAGVRVGSGSDLIGPAQQNRGRELVLRAEIEGPMAALESATAINAEILGIADDVGTIEVGKRADLVGFTADPLTDPQVFGDRDAVALVVKGGVVVRDARS